MSSSTPSRLKPLWASGAARLLRFGAMPAGARAENAVAWLADGHAEIDGAGEAPCRRILVAGADTDVRPQSEALCIARALAEAATRVILIDTSQSAAALSGPLELPRSPGFAELSQQKARFQEVIHRDPASALHFLASGKPRSLAGEWGAPSVLDKVCRAIDENYRLAIFCAEHDEAIMLARSLKRPFSAGVIVRAGNRPRARRAPSPADTEAFGFPLFWLDQQG